MRILIDGNVLLDVLQGREPHERDSRAVWGLCERGMAEGWISSLTFANIVYVMRKELTPETVSAVLGTLSQIFRFADLSLPDLKQAASMNWPDFEDALQTSAAQKCGADYIVTRNLKDFAQSPVPCLSPSDFLKLFHSETEAPEP